MNAHHAETTVNPDGSLLLKNVPFRPGDQVEVIVLARSSSPPAAPSDSGRYPLRGKPVRYDAPFEGVAESDWDAAR